ncbi:hypothetical protein D2N39_18330 [Gemmobacter lutimaris]|uniref:Uncharacterized protein n=1 Tax=Gemmobacter lutimaris TaxID=2306023 RepID=A0A398BKX2_9RHOB|nr:hypothetical protein D2N39_18330 [Gemmobacter lutimaris]
MNEGRRSAIAAGSAVAAIAAGATTITAIAAGAAAAAIAAICSVAPARLQPQRLQGQAGGAGDVEDRGAAAVEHDVGKAIAIGIAVDRDGLSGGDGQGRGDVDHRQRSVEDDGIRSGGSLRDGQGFAQAGQPVVADDIIAGRYGNHGHFDTPGKRGSG